MTYQDCIPRPLTSSRIPDKIECWELVFSLTALRMFPFQPPFSDTTLERLEKETATRENRALGCSRHFFSYFPFIGTAAEDAARKIGPRLSPDYDTKTGGLISERRLDRRVLSRPGVNSLMVLLFHTPGLKVLCLDTRLFLFPSIHPVIP